MARRRRRPLDEHARRGGRAALVASLLVFLVWNPVVWAYLWYAAIGPVLVALAAARHR